MVRRAGEIIDSSELAENFSMNTFPPGILEFGIKHNRKERSRNCRHAFVAVARFLSVRGLMVLRRMRAAVTTLVMVSAPLLLTGCMTSRLWEGEMIESFHEPAAPDGLALFQADHGGGRDIIVQYDELSPWHSSARRRTYFLHENVNRIVQREKPVFVADAAAKALMKNAVSMPIVTYTNLEPAMSATPVAPGDINSANHGSAYAIRLGDGDNHSFSIVLENGVAEGPYYLPGYRGATGNLRLAAFTPVTVTADSTIIIGVAAWIYLWAWAQGGGPIWPSSCR